MASVIVQLGILIQDPLGILGQVDVLLAQSADAQGAADLDHRVKGGTADAVVQRAVDGGQRNANRKSELPNALVLAGNFVPYDVGKFVHNSTLFTVNSRNDFLSG